MDQSFKWKKLSFVEYGDNYSICMEYPYDIRNDTTGRILKPHLANYGYYRIELWKNNHRKYYRHHMLIWISHFGSYDKTQYDIDHVDHDRANNHIENLRLVSKSLNNINISKKNGKQFEYYDELPDKIVINEEHKIYYCKQYEKFFRFVVNEYRELHECKQSNSNGIRIHWCTDKKKYTFTTTHFRDNL